MYKIRWNVNLIFIFLLLFILVDLEVAELVTLLGVCHNAQPVTKIILLKVLLGQILQVSAKQETKTVRHSLPHELLSEQVETVITISLFNQSLISTISPPISFVLVFTIYIFKYNAVPWNQYWNLSCLLNSNRLSFFTKYLCFGYVMRNPRWRLQMVCQTNN